MTGQKPSFTEVVTRKRYMSNQTLIARIETTLNATREGSVSAGKLAEVLRLNGRGLEAIQYHLLQEMESLAMDLKIAQWHDEDGFLPDLAQALERAELWLAKLPRDV